MTEIPPVPAGVILWTDADRFDALAAFYSDALGLQPISERTGHVAFAHGDFRLTLGIHSEVRGRASDPLRVMINLAVRDISATSRRLENLGVPFIRPPESEPWGGWIATLHDPDGNTIQLLQLPQEPI